jgi:hypothetical protein
VRLSFTRARSQLEQFCSIVSENFRKPIVGITEATDIFDGILLAVRALDYVLASDFRSTAIVGPYVLLYYVGLWGLIGYDFRFEKKWGFLTLAIYFMNMVFSVLAHYV